jgi:hypothetical protein
VPKPVMLSTCALHNSVATRRAGKGACCDGITVSAAEEQAPNIRMLEEIVAGVGHGDGPGHQ